MKGHITALITGLVVPLLIFLLSPYWSSMFSDNKSLEYTIFRKVFISDLDENDPVSSQIKLSFKGKDISKGTFITLLLKNTGKIPIKKEDFDTPIKIETSGGNVLASQLVDSYPAGINLQLSQSGGQTIIQPLLINPGDIFILKLFSDNDIKVQGVSARILGISNISKQEQPDKSIFAIKHIRQAKNEGATMERSVIPLPLSAIGVITSICLISAWYIFMTVALEKIIPLQILYSALSITLFLIGLTGVKMFGVYFTQEFNVSAWVNLVWSFLATCFSGVIGYVLKRKAQTLRQEQFEQTKTE